MAGVIRCGILSGGHRVGLFEKELAGVTCRAIAVATDTGESSIAVALNGIGLGRGHRIAIPAFAPFSYVRSARAAGVEPLIVDSDPSTFRMDLEDLLGRGGATVEAVLVPHLFGIPSDLEDALRIGPPILEEVSSALGSRIRGRPAGSSGHAAVCSFDPDGMITAGSGGAVASDDRILMDEVRRLIFGETEPEETSGSGRRMGEMAAALGEAQVHRLEEFLRRRREIAATYAKLLSGTGLLLPGPEKFVSPSWHRFVVRVPGGAAPLRAGLEAAGIGSPRPVPDPIHERLGLEGYPGAEQAARETLSLPIYPTLSDGEIALISDEVIKCLGGR